MSIHIEKKVRLLTGYQAVIQGALAAQCRYYFAAPSPYQSLMLAEGARHFPEVHGIFTQAETSASALAMAMGTTAMGERVLVSTNDQGFASMQEELSYCVAQELPCVIAILSDGSPGMGITIPRYNHLRYYLEPNLAGGFPLISFIPWNINKTYQLMLKAFEYSDRWRRPVLVLLDPVVFHAVQEMVLDPTDNFTSLSKKDWAIGEANHQFFCSEDSQLLTHLEKQSQEIALEISKESDNKQIPPNCEHILFSVGCLGDFLLQLNQKEWGIFVPETLWPFPIEALQHISNHAPLTWLEFGTPFLGRKIQQKFPELKFNLLSLPYPNVSAKTLKERLKQG